MPCGGVTVLFWLCLAITNTGVLPVVEAAVVAVNGTMVDTVVTINSTAVLGVSTNTSSVEADTTTNTTTHSLLVALGCFWCAEQALEQYGPGVLEAVSGYAGGSNDNPTYRNHPGHFEVIEIQYDPAKTSYSVLVEYAYRNMDPFNGDGQFCDVGSSYYPAIFYGTENERVQAETVLEEIVETYGWDPTEIAAPILPRPTNFWPAEDYHQDYYLKNPAKYGYYKNSCGRTPRLKDVWGDEEYQCYHDPYYSCFGGANATIINTQNDAVRVESNIKAAPDESDGLKIHPWLITILVLVGGAIALTGLVWILRRNY